MEGWIKLYRKFSEWEWFNISEMVHLFIYLLLNANYEPGKWRGIEIKRGQILTGLNSLNEKTGISIRTLRTCLDRLENTKEIDRQTTNKYSIITIINYESYQGGINGSDKQNDKQLTSNRQATDKQPTTNNNKENNKNEKNKIVSAKKAEMDFIDSIIQLFVEAHGDYIIVNNGEERKMAAKILGIYKSKFPNSTSEETLIALKNYFTSCVNISDSWLKTNMSLSIIVSKFNQITKILKNGNSKKSGATYADIERVTRQNFSEQITE